MSKPGSWGLMDNDIEEAILINDIDQDGDTQRGSDDFDGAKAVNHDAQFATSFSYQETRAALDQAQGRMTYVPRDSEQKVSELRNIALSRQAELGLGLDSGLSPTPYGTSSPTMDPSSASDEDYLTNPNVHPVHGRIPGGMNQVILKANPMDAYITTGIINDKTVTFLVDTGASDVSIPKRIANYIGLKPDGPAINAATAGGTIRIQKTLIDELIIGNILLRNVSASINPSDRSDKILLGMSALKRLEFTHSDGRLILRQKPV